MTSVGRIYWQTAWASLDKPRFAIRPNLLRCCRLVWMSVVLVCLPLLLPASEDNPAQPWALSAAHAAAYDAQSFYAEEDDPDASRPSSQATSRPWQPGAASSPANSPNRAEPAKAAPLLQYIQPAQLPRAATTASSLQTAEASATALVLSRLGLVPGANKPRVQLPGGRLPKARLAGSNLKGANFIRTRLQGADFSQANLADAQMMGADLADANLQGANLAGASLINAKLPQARLREARLNRANLQRAQLQNADLSEASLVAAHLERADLTGARLAGAKLWLARYSSETRFPEGFQPQRHWMIKNDPPQFGPGAKPSRIFRL
jgi:uncharacterized protein YjbI with pentapeptide repeats